MDLKIAHGDSVIRRRVAHLQPDDQLTLALLRGKFVRKSSRFCGQALSIQPAISGFAARCAAVQDVNTAGLRLSALRVKAHRIGSACCRRDARADDQLRVEGGLFVFVAFISVSLIGERYFAIIRDWLMGAITAL